MAEPDTDLKPIDQMGGARLLQVVKRRWYVVLICVLVAPSVAYLVASSQPDSYEATAKLLFRERTNTTSGTVSSSSDPDRIAATNGDLLGLPGVAQRTAKKLGGTVTVDDVSGAITTGSTPESDVFSVKATDPDAVQAALVANTYADQFIAVRAESRRNDLAGTIGALRNRLAELGKLKNPPGDELAALRSQLSTLLVSQQLEGGGVEIAQPAAVPKSPVSPKPPVDAAIGLGLGLVLGLVLAGGLEALDRRLRSVEGVASAFTRPVLGTIPESRRLARGAQKGLTGTDVEAFRMLRAHLHYYNDDRKIGSVLVTSASMAEGKTTVAWNLAAAAADAGNNVLLIEADMRRPSLARRFELKVPRGLSDVLLSEAELEDAVHAIRLGDNSLSAASSNGNHAAGDDTEGPMMDVLFAGHPLPNPVDPLESDRMASLFATVHSTYDLVVVDSPPVSIVPDAIPIIRLVDGVLLVSRIGKTTRSDAEHVQMQLENLGAPILGVVVNRIAQSESRYGYAYPTAGRRPWHRKNSAV